MSGPPFSIVCLSPQEWDAALPTNRQQIMRRAAARGHHVLFVETGDFVGRHMVRLLRGPRRASLARRLVATESVAPNIAVVKAVNLAPAGRRLGASCRVNNRLTAARLRPLAASLRPPVVAWVYDPCAAGVASALPVRLSAYDCVDDYAEQTGGDPHRRALVAAADRTAAELSRVVFATSRTQVRRLLELNANTHYVPNVADHAHFAAYERSAAAPEILRLQRPVVGFAGNLLATKVDFSLLGRLAAARPQWSFALVGPLASPDAAQPLRGLPNVHLLGARSYTDLPRYVAGFDVGLIPYLANEYTRSCFPLKTYEYLAAGKPVVATGLPELAGLEPDVVVVDGDEAVLAAVHRALLAHDHADVARRREIASRNTWETRTSALLELVDAELSGR